MAPAERDRDPGGIFSSYEGKRVVVTGCASGIGAALAQRVTQGGGSVIGLDRVEPAEGVAEFYEIDLGDSASISRAVERIGGHIDALFNVAGVSGTLGAAAVVGINFVGTRELTELLSARMRAGGAIIMTSSLAASRFREREEFVRSLVDCVDRESAQRWCERHAQAIGTGYAISKDALTWYTLRTAMVLAYRGIRVNAVAPGPTLTPILEATRAARGDAFLEAIPNPLGRIAEPAEQAAVMAFLNSDAATQVTGQVVWVDGGYSAGVATAAFPDTAGAIGHAAREPLGDAGA